MKSKYKDQPKYKVILDYEALFKKRYNKAIKRMSKAISIKVIQNVGINSKSNN